ncbi:MAG: 30S ribosome-binding factor RbfA [Saprospirales bacterium]|nr:MAG: 30S ribosome-binding factor RbfA [Saprospirales bacterium]
MASIRQLQVAETIKRHFSELLVMEGQYIYGSEPFVTVTNVVVSPDISVAKIYLSVYNVATKENVIGLLDESSHSLKISLGKRLKKHLRRIPQLEFHLDELLDEMERVDNLFDRLHAENQMGSEEE